MRRLIPATMIAAFALAAGGAAAQNVRSIETLAKERFELSKADCEMLSGIDRQVCMRDAKAKYLGFEMRCDAKMGDAKDQCLMKAKEAADREYAKKMEETG